MKARVDYDRIASRYDDDPLRAKTVDPDLVAFLEGGCPPDPASLTVLDVGCGTGSQLVADGQTWPEALLVGADPFPGMLRAAAKKSPKPKWIRAHGARLPFRGGRFHYVTCQFAFHHVCDKGAMVAEVFRLLAPGGRFVMVNISPFDMREWAIYRYFPRAWERDRVDFLPEEGIVALLEGAGFTAIRREKIAFSPDQDLRDFADTARERTVSQFLAIDESHFREGLSRIEEEIRLAGERPLPLRNSSCLLKVVADRA